MKNIETVQELIFLAYANLTMAHTAIEKGQEKYNTFNYMIRAKFFKSLKEGTMNIRSLFDDEKIKLQTGSKCNYCGSAENLVLDHIVAKKVGGLDLPENLLYACRHCNSSKGKLDLMEWMKKREDFLPILVIRRYLKLAYVYCQKNELLDKKIDDVALYEICFKLEFLPLKYPKPSLLRLNF